MEHNCTYVDSIYLDVFAIPSFASVQNLVFTDSICDLDTISLLSGGTLGQILWVTPTQDTVIANGFMMIPSDTFYDRDIWTVSGRNSLGCRIDTTIQIVRGTRPIALSSNNGPLCAGEDAQFTAATVAGANYFWYDSDTSNVIGSGATFSLSSI